MSRLMHTCVRVAEGDDYSATPLLQLIAAEKFSIWLLVVSFQFLLAASDPSLKVGEIYYTKFNN